MLRNLDPLGELIVGWEAHCPTPEPQATLNIWPQFSAFLALARIYATDMCRRQIIFQIGIGVSLD